MKFFKQNWIPLLAAIALVLAVPEGILPYAYYQLLRWGITAAAIYMGYKAFEMERIGWAWTMGIVAVVFNPIFPIHLAKETWMVIDLVVATIFATSAFRLNKTNV